MTSPSDQPTIPRLGSAHALPLGARQRSIATDRQIDDRPCHGESSSREAIRCSLLVSLRKPTEESMSKETIAVVQAAYAPFGRGDLPAVLDMILA